MSAATTKLCLVATALIFCLGLSWAARAAGRSLPDINDYADDGFGSDASLMLLTNFAYHGFGVGVSAQFAYPLFPSGFIGDPRFRDALHVEGGLDFLRWGWDVGGESLELMIFAPRIGLRYALYFTDTFAAFVGAGIGAGFARADGADGKTRFYWNTAGGVIWDLNDVISLRGEFGWGYFGDLLRIGVLFRL